MFLRLFQFLLGYSVCWYIAVQRSLLWSFVCCSSIIILFIWIPSLFSLAGIPQGLSVVLICLKNQLWVCFLYYIYFLFSISALYCFFLLVALGSVCSFSSYIYILSILFLILSLCRLLQNLEQEFLCCIVACLF